ncbi:MAG: ABC transporter permease [Acidobacteriota bacterium]
MTWRHSLHESLTELSRQGLRSVLTLLGLVVGVAAVVGMSSLTEGARLETLLHAESWGLRSVRVRARSTSGPDARADGALEALARRLHGRDEVDELAPRLCVDATARVGSSSSPARVVGTRGTHVDVMGQVVAEGRALHPDDARRHRPVTVVSGELAARLWPQRSALGESVRVGDLRFEVVGVLARPTSTAWTPPGLDDALAGSELLVPLTTLRERWPLRRPWDELRLTAADGVGARGLASVIEDERRGLGLPAARVEVVVPEERLTQAREGQRVFHSVLFGIASLSLLVGGIGIMNVMLMTVVQRAGEIGLRRAVGARRRDVVQQFLLESALLATTGGALGLLLGVGLAAVLSARAGWLTVVSPATAALALGSAVTTGLLFGAWPAARAAALDPVEALRRE